MNIEAKNLSKIYGDGENRVVALDHANLEIVSSNFISIMGPSGSGKSTLLHLLSGLDKPSSGSLTYDCKDIYSYSDKELSAFRRKRIGFIFQQFNLLPVLTAKENIIMPLLLDKQKPNEAYLKQLTELLGIQGRRRCTWGQTGRRWRRGRRPAAPARAGSAPGNRASVYGRTGPAPSRRPRRRP